MDLLFFFGLKTAYLWEVNDGKRTQWYICHPDLRWGDQKMYTLIGIIWVIFTIIRLQRAGVSSIIILNRKSRCSVWNLNLRNSQETWLSKRSKQLRFEEHALVKDNPTFSIIQREKFLQNSTHCHIWFRTNTRLEDQKSEIPSTIVFTLILESLKRKDFPPQACDESTVSAVAHYLKFRKQNWKRNLPNKFSTSSIESFREKMCVFPHWTGSNYQVFKWTAASQTLSSSS